MTCNYSGRFLCSGRKCLLHHLRAIPSLEPVRVVRLFGRVLGRLRVLRRDDEHRLVDADGNHYQVRCKPQRHSAEPAPGQQRRLELQQIRAGQKGGLLLRLCAE